jgi:deaminated glutathione amidase
MVDVMKIAIAQLTPGADKSANLDKARDYIAAAKARGADLILIPELYMAYLPAGSTVSKADVAEPLDGPFVTGLAEAARENAIHVICGVIESKPGETARAYNTTVFFDRAGKLLQVYRKTHLYDAFARKESDTIIPGAEPVQVVDTEFGKVGVFVCYELRFPEIARKLAVEGADILFLPTAWVAGAMKEDHLHTLLRARAIENTVYICAADQVGNIYSGRSIVVDPMGVVVASAGEEEALFVAEIDPERIRRVRNVNPCVRDRRPELYL